MIDDESIKKIAFLSRIRINDDKLEETKAGFNNILQWVEQLNELNTENVEPLISVNKEAHLTLRKDTVTDKDMADKVLANAPSSEYGHFVVPKVIE